MKIDKNIPVPKRKGWARAEYPLRELEVGHSFYLEFNGEDKYVVASKLRQAASQFKLRNPGFNYATRTDEKGIRLWRVEHD